MSSPVPDFDIDMSADFLEDSLLDDSPECEARHEQIGVECSVEVTHRFITSCHGSINVCRSISDYALSEIANRLKTCERCHRPTHECWRVVAI